jgi:hypothetical protein
MEPRRLSCIRRRLTWACCVRYGERQGQHRKRGGKVIECRKCTAGECSHGTQCSMAIRWYDDPWDGTFWRRCECTASIDAGVYPVTVSRVAKRC